MSEHTLQLAMLVFVAFLNLVGLYLVYLVHRSSKQIEGLTAATFLEARRALERYRP